MLKFEQVSFSYGKKKVLEHFSFSLGTGEILALMGDSGCGKSTVLNLAAGLRKPSEGNITSNAAKLSYVFQEPRLLPWLTVEENIRAVLPKNENNDEAILQALQTVELHDTAGLYPDELSGGMKSRVSLARALAYGGDLFLLDEPFAALQEELCERLSRTLRDHLKEKGASALLVTHRRKDAELLADRILTL